MDIDADEQREADRLTHLAFDPVSGRVLGTVGHAAGEPCRCEEDDSLLVALVPDDQPETVPRLMPLPDEVPARLSELRVDPRSRALVPLPRLVIDPERTVLEGDGEDEIEVAILAVGPDGAVMEDFSGEVKVQTARGKLSEHGGSVTLEHGRARIRLTSVRETVDEVPLAVSAPDGSAMAATTSVTFA